MGCKQELVTYSFVLGNWISKYMQQEEVMKFCEEKNFNVICSVSQLRQCFPAATSYNLLINIQAMNDHQCKSAHTALLQEIERFVRIVDKLERDRKDQTEARRGTQPDSENRSQNQRLA